ncbi:carbonic anhydrase family protein [Sphingorhabdus sp. Alg239-R122]|uniref:carbonic anhydrase n=1 Tax=Sphingorhabdus sp. Alg239-R122 TaxID=2305989 RepID=UPI0013DB0461|nr:carbonic anhydrase family protein [Sphingorhabdus sp. Alg239-R122]
MRKIALICSGVAALALTACTQQADDTEAKADKADKVVWDYDGEEGPENWGDLSAEFATCKTGTQQSPIDLPARGEAKTVDVTTNYGSQSAKIVDKGYTVQADFAEGASFTSGDTTFNLLQMHMHTPSEHTVTGKSYPLVAHFVHQSGEGEFGVLGILFEEGEANASLQTILDNVGGETDVDIAAMLPSALTAYNYPGSLTTPPCSEGVNWHVVASPATASAEQIEALNGMMKNNARPVQPLNERTLTAAE